MENRKVHFFLFLIGLCLTLFLASGCSEDYPVAPDYPDSELLIGTWEQPFYTHDKLPENVGGMIPMNRTEMTYDLNHTGLITEYPFFFPDTIYPEDMIFYPGVSDTTFTDFSWSVEGYHLQIIIDDEDFNRIFDFEENRLVLRYNAPVTVDGEEVDAAWIETWHKVVVE